MKILLQAGWKENLATFMNELKNLQCVGLTTLGAALKHALDVLNINRMQTGIDTYGQGRCPFYLEPSVIVVITDGGKYTTNSGVHPDVSAGFVNNPRCIGRSIRVSPFVYKDKETFFAVHITDAFAYTRIRADEGTVSVGSTAVLVGASFVGNTGRRTGHWDGGE